ncbi:MAG: UDP-N-acetylmuramoyl-L-alanyl-D-glutamate--2,6-diaminopimelate ligase [Chitinophagaceae bacterium]|nr:MAG: UDP-N-acetylmuramoyl-L-alanyl-D-glutamate--2,6-diaminopimelate ligase [Chitinophagaceae bacterium]
MKKFLKDILYTVPLDEVYGNTACEINALEFDSRKLADNDVFFAIKGLKSDGHDFIPEAEKKNVRAIVHSDQVKNYKENITYIKVADVQAAMGIMAANYFGQPANKLKLIGVTGTNGKTTVVSLLFQLFTKLGFKVGLISTVEYKIANKTYPSSFTTPDTLQLNKLFHEMVENGCEYVFMEVSSHAIEQKRIAGLKFTGAVFTNISHDHLDYHLNFQNYITAKKKLFDSLGSMSFALVNVDDKRGTVMLQNTKARKRTFSLYTMADYKGKLLEQSFEGMLVNINSKEVFSLLLGEHNAWNLLTVFAVAIELGIPEEEIFEPLSALKAPEGRFDYIKISKNGITGIVDFAHTPDALKNTLAAINNMKNQKQQVITVIGCGGNRDKEKRPLMARIAAEMSDRVILTSDNPRNEDPQAIIKEMKAGLHPALEKKALSIPDRKEAIQLACSLSKDQDIILVAGKGHEKYQEINGEKHPFDDKLILIHELKILNT